MSRLPRYIFIILISAAAAFSQTRRENYQQLLQHALHISIDPEQKEKCGFPTFVALHEATLKRPELAALFKAAFQRPSLPKWYITPDSLFRIHYTLTGADAVNPASTIPEAIAAGVPDYIYEAGLAAQKANHLLRDVLGFAPPVDDLGEDGPEYDIYVINEISDYGHTSWDFLDASGRGPAYSFVDNDYVGYKTTGLAALRVTVAHEYFHGVQLNYRFRNEDTFFLEMSSTWFEDFAYDEVNDYYNYLGNFFSDPDTPLNETKGYESCVWLHYLVQRLLTPRIVLDLWKEVKLEPALSSFKTVLESTTYNLPFSQAFSEFYTWCYFTGPRADAAHYFEEGAYYPQIQIKQTFAVSRDTALADGLRALAANFYRAIRKPQDLQLFLQTAEPGRWMVTAISNSAAQGYLLRSEVGLTPIEVAASLQEDTVAVAVVNTSIPSSVNQSMFYNYQLQIKFSSNFQLANVLEKPWPNPFSARKGLLFFPFRINQRMPVEAAIVREDGKTLRTFKLGELGAGAYPNKLFWDGRDDSGDRVASGVYFLLLRAGDFQATTKFVVIN